MKQRILARERQRIADLEEALIGVLGDLAELVVDEECDHGVNICWCGIVSRIVGAASLIDGRFHSEAVERIADRFPPGAAAAPSPPGVATRWEVVLGDGAGSQRRLHVEAPTEREAANAARLLMNEPKRWRVVTMALI